MRTPLVTSRIPGADESVERPAGPDDREACAADGFLKFFAQEWTSHIVLALARHGALRFGALRRQLPPGLSARVLSARLKALEAAGYVERRDLSGRVLHVEYSLTPSGLAVDAALASSESLMSAGLSKTGQKETSGS